MSICMSSSDVNLKCFGPSIDPYFMKVESFFLVLTCVLHDALNDYCS